MQGKRILLIISGGIAAYKCLELIRRLRDRGASVRVILTRAAQQFVTPLSVSTLSETPAFTDLFDLTQESEIGHIRLSREADLPRRADHMMTSFVVRVRNIPAALYKAMGGFATNGVNMTKLESYMVGGSFTATQFYADVEGHPEDRNVQLALEELGYFTTNLHILGTYPADRARD